MPNDIAIRFLWGSRPESPAQISERVLQTTEALAKLDPLFQSWWFVDEYIDREYVPLRRVRSRMESLIEYAVMRDDFGDPEPDCGYSCFMTTRTQSEADEASFRIRAGIEKVLTLGHNDIVFSTAYDKNPDPRLVAYPLFKAMMMTVSGVWNVAVATAFCPALPQDMRTLDRMFAPSWMTYLAAPLAARVTLPDGVECERMADGGLLMIATTETFDASNEDHVEAAWAISDALAGITKADIV